MFKYFLQQNTAFYRELMLERTYWIEQEYSYSPCSTYDELLNKYVGLKFDLRYSCVEDEPEEVLYFVNINDNSRPSLLVSTHSWDILGKINPSINQFINKVLVNCRQEDFRNYF